MPATGRSPDSRVKGNILTIGSRTRRRRVHGCSSPPARSGIAERARTSPKSSGVSWPCCWDAVVRVALATRGGTFGALVEDVRLPNWELYVGQTLMPEVVADYDPGDREHCGHTPEMIQRALERFAAPPGADVPETFHAFDVFAGYLVFDALLAHGDRHIATGPCLSRHRAPRSANRCAHHSIMRQASDSP